MRQDPPVYPPNWPLTEMEYRLAHIGSDPKYFIRRSACYTMPYYLHTKHNFSYVQRYTDSIPNDTLLSIVERRVRTGLPIVITYNEPTRTPHFWDIARLFRNRPVELTFYQRLNELKTYVYDAHVQSTMFSPERQRAKDFWATFQILFDKYQEKTTQAEKDEVAKELDGLEFQVSDLRRQVNKRFGPRGWNPELPPEKQPEGPSEEDLAKYARLKSLSNSASKEGSTPVIDFDKIVEIEFN
jgi:hypothetical protein